MRPSTGDGTLKSAARTSRLWCALLLGLALSAGGASCRVQHWLYPCELPPDASLEDVLAVVNYNGQLVRSLIATDVEISGNAQGQIVPTLKARLALEKPRRFRLLADSPLGTGTEVDLGSNEEQFWFWVLRNEPPALYVCRHEDFSRAARQLAIPFHPEWLVDALGITPLDAPETFDGPAVPTPGRLEIRAHRRSPQGEPVTHVVVLDSCNGRIIEQHLINASGQQVAGAVASDFQRDPASGAVIPRRVDLRWPQAQLTLRVRLRDLQVNEIPAGLTRLWQRPEIPGYPVVNLCAPGVPLDRARPDPRAGPAGGARFRTRTERDGPQPRP